MKATRILQEQHRHIEQGLALLETQAEHGCEEDFASLVVELTAHLAAEENVFYPRAEQVLGRPLVEQRRQTERVRQAVRRAAGVGEGADAPLHRRLFDLTEAFRAHARAEEAAVHPSVEGLLGSTRLEALGERLAAFHAAVAKAGAPRT